MTRPWLQTTFRVGDFRCTMTMVTKPERGKVMTTGAEWHPSVPKYLNRKCLRQYRAGRNALYAEAARLTGMRTALIEL
jgi:hypothetical protein